MDETATPTVTSKHQDIDLFNKQEYKHDCDSCVFIKNGVLDNRTVTDIYVCPNEIPTIVVRYSNEGSDYWSMDIDCLLTPAATGSETRRQAFLAIGIAVDRGIITGEHLVAALRRKE